MNVQVLSWGPSGGNPSPTRQGRRRGSPCQCQRGQVALPGIPVRGGLKEAIGVNLLRTQVKRRKARTGGKPAPSGEAHIQRPRACSGDVMESKSAGITRRDLLGPAVAIVDGLRTNRNEGS
jgi:hypothetical protein